MDGSSAKPTLSLTRKIEPEVQDDGEIGMACQCNWVSQMDSPITWKRYQGKRLALSRTEREVGGQAIDLLGDSPGCHGTRFGLARTLSGSCRQPGYAHEKWHRNRVSVIDTGIDSIKLRKLHHSIAINMINNIILDFKLFTYSKVK